MTHSSNCIHYHLVLSKTLLLMTLNLERWAAPPCNRWKGVFAGWWEKVCIWCRKGCLGMSPFYYRSWTCESEDHLEFKDISFYRWETHSFIHQQIHKERLLNVRFSSRCSGDIEQKTQGPALCHALPVRTKDNILINAFRLDEGVLRKVRLGNVTEGILRGALL